MVKAEKIAYWGDIDSWGLQLLARARQLQPEIHALLMEQEIYDKFSDHALRAQERGEIGAGVYCSRTGCGGN